MSFAPAFGIAIIAYIVYSVFFGEERRRTVFRKNFDELKYAEGKNPYNYYNPLMRNYADLSSYNTKQNLLTSHMNEYYEILNEQYEEDWRQRGIVVRRPEDLLISSGEKVLFWVYYSPCA